MSTPAADNTNQVTTTEKVEETKVDEKKVEEQKPIEKKKKTKEVSKASPEYLASLAQYKKETRSDKERDNQSYNNYAIISTDKANPKNYDSLFHRILDSVMKHPYAYPFLEPVDYVALNIPDYPSVITNPIDLGTIKKKLNEKAYFADPFLFIKDMSLLFDNCYHYNESWTDVSDMGETLQKIFLNYINSSQLFTKAEIAYAREVSPKKYEAYHGKKGGNTKEENKKKQEKKGGSGNGGEGGEEEEGEEKEKKEQQNTKNNQGKGKNEAQKKTKESPKGGEKKKNQKVTEKKGTEEKSPVTKPKSHHKLKGDQKGGKKKGGKGEGEENKEESSAISSSSTSISLHSPSSSSSDSSNSSSSSSSPALSDLINTSVSDSSDPIEFTPEESHKRMMMIIQRMKNMPPNAIDAITNHLVHVMKKEGEKVGRSLIHAGEEQKKEEEGENEEKKGKEEEEKGGVDEALNKLREEAQSPNGKIYHIDVKEIPAREIILLEKYTEEIMKAQDKNKSEEKNSDNNNNNKVNEDVEKEVMAKEEAVPNEGTESKEEVKEVEGMVKEEEKPEKKD